MHHWNTWSLLFSLFFFPSFFFYLIPKNISKYHYNRHFHAERGKEQHIKKFFLRKTASVDREYFSAPHTEGRNESRGLSRGGVLSLTTRGCDSWGALSGRGVTPSWGDGRSRRPVCWGPESRTLNFFSPHVYTRRGGLANSSPCRGLHRSPGALSQLLLLSRVLSVPFFLFQTSSLLATCLGSSIHPHRDRASCTVNVYVCVLQSLASG